MKPGVDKIRRSKRQAGVDVSPDLLLKHKKQKKASKEVNERERTVENSPDKEAIGQDYGEQEDGNVKDSHVEEEKEQDFTRVENTEKDIVVEAEEEEAVTRVGNNEKDRVVRSQGEEEGTTPTNTKGVSNTSETPTKQSENKKKKARGPTKMRKVAKHIEDKVEVEFNELGEHVGRGSVTLSSFLGPLVREHVPVLLDDWRHLGENTKHALWEEIHVFFLVFLIEFEFKITVLVCNLSIFDREDSTCQKNGKKMRYLSRWVVCGGHLNLGFLPKFELLKTRINYRKLSLATSTLDQLGTHG